MNEDLYGGTFFFHKFPSLIEAVERRRADRLRKNRCIECGHAMPLMFNKGNRPARHKNCEGNNGKRTA